MKVTPAARTGTEPPWKKILTIAATIPSTAKIIFGVISFAYPFLLVCAGGGIGADTLSASGGASRPLRSHAARAPMTAMIWPTRIIIRSMVIGSALLMKAPTSATIAPITVHEKMAISRDIATALPPRPLQPHHPRASSRDSRPGPRVPSDPTGRPAWPRSSECRAT